MGTYVLLEALKTGMVTAEPVFNHLGQLLLGKGVPLSARHLTVLRTWGIQKTLVEGGESNEESPVTNEAIRKQALARINQRLFWHPENPWEKEIVHLAVQQAIQRSLETGL